MYLKLPCEIIDIIFSNLSIEDCRNLLRAYDNAYSTKCKRLDFPLTETHEKFNNIFDSFTLRTNIFIYLSNYFSNPLVLLKSMLINNVILSGSRVVEFFCANSATENSSWDFFIHYDKYRIASFMHDTNILGIKWLSIHDWIGRQLNNSETTIYLSTNEVQLLLDLHKSGNFKSETLDAISTLSEKHSHFPHRDTIYFITNSKGIKKKVVAYSSIYNTNNGSLIHGELYYKNKITPVQLMVSMYSQHTPLESIINFNSSVSQCFISGSTAVHMYKADAYSRNSTLWGFYKHHDFDDNTCINMVLSTYKSKQFTFKDKVIIRNDSKNIPIIRYIRDLDCEYIKLHDRVQDLLAKFIAVTSNDKLSVYDAILYTEAKEHIICLYSWDQDNNRLCSGYYNAARVQNSIGHTSKFETGKRTSTLTSAILQCALKDNINYEMLIKVEDALYSKEYETKCYDSLDLKSMYSNHNISTILSSIVVVGSYVIVFKI